MYRTTGVDTIATITELRAKTTELVEHVRRSGQALLIQKNNEPFAVLLNWDVYNKLMDHRSEKLLWADRKPHARENRGAASQGEPAQSMPD